MKSQKETVAMMANIAEMVLQSRISPHPQQLQRLETVKSEIEVLRHHQHPSDEFLYFLVDRQFYQVKSRLLAQQRRAPSHPLSLALHFTLFDKESSLSQTVQIWKLMLNRKQVYSMEVSAGMHELVNLVRQALRQVTLQYNFSELIRNKETSRRYIIDYKIIIGESHQEMGFDSHYSMATTRARVNALHEITLSCYWREKLNLAPISPYKAMNQLKKGRNGSEETRVDSCSVESLQEMNIRKYCSVDQQQQQAFEVYDPDLDMTIISSDSDSLSKSRHLVQEITIGEVDEFELLIEEAINEDQMFLIENESLLQNWQKSLCLNFN